MTTTAAIERFHALTADPDAIHAIIERDGAVILEGLLSAEVVARVNDEVGAVLDDADPDAELFNPIMKAFHGPCTKQVAGACAISPTFATEVMCHPLLLALCDRILLPSCARYQLNLGHLLQRGPGADEQLLHRDEAVWSDVPKPAPELQLATVIAFVDFTRENGGTRIVPGSHRWPDRSSVAGRAVRAAASDGGTDCVRGDARRLRRGLHGRDHPRRRVQHHRDPPAWCAPQLLPGVAADGGEQLPGGPSEPSRPSSHAKRRNCSATPFTTASRAVAAISGWCACKTRSSSLAGTNSRTDWRMMFPVLDRARPPQERQGIPKLTGSNGWCRRWLAAMSWYRSGDSDRLGECTEPIHLPSNEEGSMGKFAPNALNAITPAKPLSKESRSAMSHQGS